MGRSVPVRQMLRRLQLIGWRKLEPRLLPGEWAEAPEWRDDLPMPVFPPRCEQWRWDGKQPWIQLPWGQRKVVLPMDWSPPLRDWLDGSWRARLNYMEYLEGADDRWFQALVEDWLSQVTLEEAETRRFGWRAFNLSIRSVVWMQQVAVRRQSLDMRLLNRMARSLARQMIYLERHLETDLRGNHLIKNIKALLWAGRCFMGSDATRWRELGEKWLARELGEQILDDGVHYERSPSYHCQVLADLVECRQTLGAGGLRDELDEAIARMGKAMVCLAHPDGLVAQFNDGGLNSAYRPEQIHRVLGGDSSSPDGIFELPNAGYFGRRSDDEYLIVDCGKLAPDYLIGHGHGDILSFEWSLGSKRFVVDQGTFQNLGGERRAMSRSTISHNTVSVAGVDQGDFYGAHRCGRRPNVELVSFQRLNGGFRLVGRHDGFRHLEGSPWHRRVFTSEPGKLAVEDHIDGAKADGYGRLLFHPDCNIQVRGNSARITHGRTKLDLTADRPLKIVAAEWYPNLYQAVQTHRLEYRLDGSEPAKLNFLRIE